MVEFDILRAIKAKLELNVLVAHVDIYNAQYENESEEEAFNYPAVFVEFPGSQWVQKFEAQNSGVTASQISEGMNVIVHCCYNSLRNPYDTIDTGLEAFLESVYHDIQGISGDNFTELKRINSTQFNPYENVLIWKFTFSTIAEQEGATSDLTDATDGGEIDLTLVTNKDLLIDNQLIRTGVVVNQFTLVDNGSDTTPYTGIPFTVRKTITLNALETENKDFRAIVKWNGYNDQVFNGTLAQGESYSFESTFTFTEAGVGVMQIIGTVFTKNIYDVQVPIPTFSLADNGTDVIATEDQLFTIRKTLTRTDSFPILANYTVIFDWGVLGIETITGTLATNGSVNIESAKILTGIVGNYSIDIDGSVTDIVSIVVAEPLPTEYIEFLIDTTGAIKTFSMQFQINGANDYKIRYADEINPVALVNGINSYTYTTSKINSVKISSTSNNFSKLQSFIRTTNMVLTKIDFTKLNFSLSNLGSWALNNYGLPLLIMPIASKLYNINLSGNQLTGNLDLSWNLDRITNAFTLKNNPGLTSITFNESLVPAPISKEVDVSNCSLDVTTVDRILKACADTGISSGVNRFCNLNGGTNATPSAAGIINRNLLISRGWTVPIN